MLLEKTPESPLDCKEIQPVNPRGNQSWIFIGRTDVETNSNTLATWCEELTNLKRPWYWERSKVGGEGDGREGDGWMASLIQWIWVWVNSGNWWLTGSSGVLQFMGSQRVRHDWVTELNWPYIHVILFRWPQTISLGFPCGSAAKESACNSGFDPWVGRIPWRRERLPTPVFWPGEFHGLYSPWGHKESDTTEQLSLHFKAFPNWFSRMHIFYCSLRLNQGS